MADGDYTIPTYPATVGVGGHREGLEGKDAVLIHSLHDQDGKRDLTADVHKNSKEDALVSLETKFQLAMDQKESDRRAEVIHRQAVEQMHVLRREVEAQVLVENEKTRQLIRDMEDRRARDARDAKTDATLAAILAKVSVTV